MDIRETRSQCTEMPLRRDEQSGKSRKETSGFLLLQVNNMLGMVMFAFKMLMIGMGMI